MAVSRHEWINRIAAHGYGFQANTPIWAIVVRPPSLLT